MGLFKQVDGEVAIVVDKGRFRQCNIFTRDGYLYAQIGGAFVRLNADASTTVPTMRLDHLTWTGPLMRDPLGRLCTAEVPKAALLDAPKYTVLLGLPAPEQEP